MYYRLQQVSEAEHYIRNNESLMRTLREVDSVRKELLEKYEHVLTDSEKCNASGIFWGCRSEEEYRSKFLTTVLIPAYNVFDKTHCRYNGILNAIKENNPEWVSAFENAHKHKLKVCKVSVYPLEETQAT